MAEFKLFQFEFENYNDVVLLTDTDDLYFTQKSIFCALEPSRGSNFKVLVDMFLRNGFSYNRFTLLEFYGSDKCNSFLINSRNVSANIKTQIRNYLNSKHELFSESSLSKATIDYLKSKPY